MAKKNKELLADLQVGTVHKFSDDAHEGIKFETTDLPCVITLKDVPESQIEEKYEEFLTKSFDLIKAGKKAYEAFLQELNKEEDEDEDEDEDGDDEEEDEEDDEEGEEDDDEEEEEDEDDEEEDGDDEDDEDDDEEEEDDDEDDEDDEEDEEKTVKLSKKELAGIMDFVTVIKTAKTAKALEKAAKTIKKSKAIKKCNKKQKDYIKLTYQQRADELS